MNLQIEQILVAAAFLLWLDIFIVIRTLYNKTHLQLNANRRAQELAELAHLFEANTDWDKKKSDVCSPIIFNLSNQSTCLKKSGCGFSISRELTG